MEKRNQRIGVPVCNSGSGRSGQVDLGFGFDDEEGVGVGVAGGAEFLAGIVEGVG